MVNPDKKPSVTVEELLRLKRSEIPDNHFWESFEKDFQRRRLQVLVGSSRVKTVFWQNLLKGAAVVCPLLMFAGIFYTTQGTASADQNSALIVNELSPAPMPSGAIRNETSLSREALVDFAVANSGANRFVVDALRQSEGSARSFEKVLHSPSLSMPARPGAVYVRDSFVADEYRVTTAEVRLGRNF